MPNHIRTIRLRGEDVRVLFRSKILMKDQDGKLFECDGLADPPGTINRALRIRRGMSEAETLRFLLHEMLHICLWDLDELAIDEISSDLEKALTDLGYRRSVVDGKGKAKQSEGKGAG